MYHAMKQTQGTGWADQIERRNRMKRVMIAILFLVLCIGLPPSAEARSKNPVPDMSGMNIFLGWIDLGSGSYKDLGYETREDWDKVIASENTGFQEYFQTKMTGRTVVLAKNKDGVNTAGNDLYIKFVDVSVDHGYRLHISVQIIDLKTNTVIATIPHMKLNGHFCTLRGCLAKDLDVVNEKLQSLLNGPKK
jgi:hypothetical protein